jgi:hypothetical protein
LWSFEQLSEFVQLPNQLIDPCGAVELWSPPSAFEIAPL